MAGNKDRIISGFIGMNTGSIKNCYTKMQLKAKKNISGFCGMNGGEILSSISECSYSANKNIIGFCRNTKGISNCYCVLGKKQKIEALEDKSYGEIKEIVIEKLKENQSWKKENNELILHKKMFQETKNELEQTITIHTEQELFDVAEKVNQGFDEYVYARIELAGNIDLKGKKWIPIGKGEMTPFCGVLNGNGYKIHNFVVSQKKAETAGFFGYIKEAVVENLQIDCIIHGGKYAGALAGINDGGKVLGCQAAVKGDAQYCFGGLIGKNSGIVEQCSCMGQAQNPMPIGAIASVSSAAAICVAVASVVLFMNGKDNGRTTYPAIPVSKEAVPIEGDHDEPMSNGNSVSYQVETKLVCEKGNDMVNVNFKNPGKSNHNIVVSLQITDEELLNTIGSTGRRKEEQEKLEQDETYNVETSRVTIAESGSVPPGYEMATLELQTLEDGSVLPKGTYDAIVYLSLYDIYTNEKAMVNSQIPVKLVVKG